jgi:hypothetical protein
MDAVNIQELIQTGGVAGVLIWVVLYFMRAIGKKDEQIERSNQQVIDVASKSNECIKDNTVAVTKLKSVIEHMSDGHGDN